ncbi:hypothetical protein THRCLA_01118 [Thraustotheca clavata]|uniref:TIP41-like protein n=1 Tax=Thraustotheca clavata TaxID=74557 RepID=A0A1W0A980_9STRA|nr:hypothetical protein THRCLA_01118 [Thraustotheca clavata]
MSKQYCDHETSSTVLLKEAVSKLQARASLDDVQAHPDGLNVFNIRDWIVAAKKSHITPLNALDELGASIKMTPPEMVFGHNQLLVVHQPTGLSLSFIAIDALAHCHFKEGQQDQLKVSVAKDKSSCEVKELEITYDWTYTTDYKGTLGRANPENNVAMQSNDQPVVRVEDTTDRIDFEKLKVREPILWMEEINLYEDELHDHGISVMSIRMRIMPSGFYILARYWMRLDHVVVRLNETRLHHIFGTDHIMREYTAKEIAFDTLFAQGHPNHMAHYTNIDTYQHLLPTIQAKYQKIYLSNK